MSAALALVCPNCDHEVVQEAQFCHLCGAVLPSHAPRVASPLPVIEFGELWRRFLACVIDGFLVTLMVIPTCLAFTWIMEVLSSWQVIGRDDARFMAGMSAVLFYLVADWIYNARQISSRHQATLGKRWMGLKVTDLSGGPVSFAQATGRHFAKFLSVFALLVGFFVAAFSKRHQALHDMVAGTLVLKSK